MIDTYCCEEFQAALIRGEVYVSKNGGYFEIIGEHMGTRDYLDACPFCDTDFNNVRRKRNET